MSVRIQQDDFDLNEEVRVLTDVSAGAVVSFVGLVRADKLGDSAVRAMTLEHYPGMTESSIRQIIAQAKARWQCQGVRVIHRIGRLLPGEQIVMVAVASGHRGDAFAACEFIMDFLKTQAPFWKKEELQDGRYHWVDARDSDTAAAQRWSQPV